MIDDQRIGGLVQQIDLPWHVGGVFATVEFPLTLRISNVETRSDVLKALNSLFQSGIREKIEFFANGDGLWLSREGADMQITLGWESNPEAIKPITEIWEHDE